MSEAVDILAKNLMILASAGSGKTYQLVNRVIGLIWVRDADPSRIVALTFTRKAAGEFADELLRKLASCARDPAAAALVAAQIGRPELDFSRVLERVTRDLPRLFLGTIDSFFARVVRCFPHELGLADGRFELIEGPRLEAAVDDVLAGVLGDVSEGGEAEEFLHAFRRATAGQQGARVAEVLRGFIQTWHGRWKSGGAVGVGRAAIFGELPEVGSWEVEKVRLVAGVRNALAGAEWTHKAQPDAVARLLDCFEAHTVGSGVVAQAGSLFESLVAAAAAGQQPLRLKSYRDFTLPEAADRSLGGLLRLLAGCELAAARERTVAVQEVVARHDAECGRRLRARGMFGFDDVKCLMRAWKHNEEARLSREQIDYRLDARHDHWLLDEFQDTSPAEWEGLENLLDEAASRDDGTLFVVGDKKQAIYSFKGGDVRLFDRVHDRYGGGSGSDLSIATMRESWRSCPAVLELVNRVCGNRDVIGELFGGDLAGRWEWEDHVSAKPDRPGEARVETVAGKDPERLERMVAILREIGVGQRALTCGVLVRTNKELREVAEHLREEGFDVIEEGQREPAADNLPGVAIRHLIRWLADPADAMARGVVAMSPLEESIRGRHGEHWQARWEGLNARALEVGLVTMVEELIEPMWGGWSEFNRRRAGDVLWALAAHDASGASVRDAARMLEDLKAAHAPGVAAVQVMTIHKSKGLGFDVVILPKIGGDKVPDFGNYRVAEGDGWVLQAPAKWVRAQFAELAAAEERWASEQKYGALCLLYVALTRAKRGLYVLLPEPPKSAKDPEERASLANLITRACGGEFQTGDGRWFEGVAQRVAVEKPAGFVLGEAVPRRPRRTPSGAKTKSAIAPAARSRGGMEFGTAVHAAFERIEWLDQTTGAVPADEVGRLVARTLAEPAVKEWFVARPGREVFREQAVEAILDGAWLSGVIDRLLIERDEAGRVTTATVIDFKTDAVQDAVELRERYGAQMQAYRRVMERAFPGSRVDCLLVSTALGQVVPVEAQA